MKEKMPHCPNCKINNFVVLDKQSIQVGTAIGGLAGAGAIYAGTRGKTSGSNPIAVIMALLMPLLTGFLAGAKVGCAIGEQIDGNMRIRYRCNGCGRKFNG
jgi:hypothetical protein